MAPRCRSEYFLRSKKLSKRNTRNAHDWRKAKTLRLGARRRRHKRRGAEICPRRYRAKFATDEFDTIAVPGLEDLSLREPRVVPQRGCAIHRHTGNGSRRIRQARTSRNMRFSAIQETLCKTAS